MRSRFLIANILVQHGRNNYTAKNSAKAYPTWLLPFCLLPSGGAVWHWERTLKAPSFCLLVLACFLARPVAAQIPSSSSISCTVPLDSQLLDEENVITDKTISEEGLTIPSLWWAKEQFDPFGGRLINHWLAYPNERRIDIVVNRQLWSLLDYLERYRFVNEFGTVARDYQYNLRIFDRQKKCLVTYSCNFQATPHQCAIDFEPSGRTGLQVDTVNQKW
jgi:hypothetical protein